MTSCHALKMTLFFTYFDHGGLVLQFNISDAAEDLKAKVGVFRDLAANGKTVYLTFVTVAGIVQNAHSGIVQSEVTLDDLFRP